MVEIDEKQAFSIIQKAKDSGSIRIGVNEVTKAIERGVAKAVFFANDVNPSEIVAHLPGLSKEMGVLCASIGNKSELGAAIGIKSTTAIAIIDAGSAKKELEKLSKDEISAKKVEAAEEKTEKVEKAEATEE